MGSSGEITSPEYPSNYPDNSNVAHIIEVTEGLKIELEILNFDLEHQSLCYYDFCQVLDTDGKEIGKFCGTKVPPTIISSGSKMSVIFQSDKDINHKGFKATWKETTQDSWSIWSENFPQNYFNNENKVKLFFCFLFLMITTKDKRTRTSPNWNED